MERFSEINDNSPNILRTVVLGMNLSQQSFSRAVFSFWDFLGDVGGLYDMLILIGGQIVALIQLVIGSGLNRFLIRNLFQVDKNVKTIQPHQSTTLVERIASALSLRKPAKFRICARDKSNKRF